LRAKKKFLTSEPKRATLRSYKGRQRMPTLPTARRLVMIRIAPQAQADQEAAHGACVQCASPYLNPAHVLSPPRHWLEALVDGGMSWEFFRLRYKNLLRKRFAEDSEAFHTLLESSEGDHALVLTCHCLAGPCHLEVAREFLEQLRDRAPY